MINLCLPLTGSAKQYKMAKKKKAAILDNHELYIRNLFAKNLKRLRNERDISQMELADIANLSTTFINEIENERKWPSIESLTKLVKALGVEPNQFFTPDIVMEPSDADILKSKLASLITSAVNESIDSYTVYTVPKNNNPVKK